MAGYARHNLCNTTENVKIHFKSDFANKITCYSWCSYVQSPKPTVQKYKYYFGRSTELLAATFIILHLWYFKFESQWSHMNAPGHNQLVKCSRERMGSNVVPLQHLFNLDQLDVNFWKTVLFESVYSSCTSARICTST